MDRVRLGIVVLLVAAVVSAPPSHASPARTDIHDIRGALPVSGAPPFALTAALLLAGACLTRLMLRRRRPVPAPLRCEIGQNPVETVEQLAASYRGGDAPPDLLCLRLAALIRSALACRTGLPAGRLTTGELLERISIPDLLSAGDLELAGQMLYFCDRVKFAGYAPDDVETEWLLSAAVELLCGRAEERHEVS